MHALVQIIHDVLYENIPILEENKRKVLRRKDALVNLGELDVPYKTKRQTLVQEAGNFIQDLYNQL